VFKIGDLIANRYRVKDIVGSGGAGVVYRAHDQEIDVDVAVKVINAKLVQTSDEQRLFSRQTKISRKLSHQNVVRIYDEGRDEKRPYFTMQFLEGLSLRRIIDLRKEKRQTFNIHEVEPIFNQLCQALDYAHKTTFHGNLKPDNVIVLPDLLKITDFALLRGLPRKPFLAIQKSRGSNFRYLAPEVRLEVPDLNKSVDLYCLGVVLCEMLTGTVYDDAKPEQLTVATTGLDNALISIVKRCVARAPKDRYSQAGELYEDLRSVMSKGRIENHRVPAPVADPGPAAEAPTQRLDIAKHGERPVKEDSKPVEVVVDEMQGVGARGDDDAIAAPPPERPPEEERREPSETFSLIDDDMIESAAPSAASASASAQKPAEGKSNGVPKNGAAEHLGEVHPVPGDVSDEALMDDPEPAEGRSEFRDRVGDDAEEETELHEEDDPTEAVLEEISNSAIELIADPRATNVMHVDVEGGTISHLPERHHPTVQPAPLPDSALPAPAFANVAREPTQQGRLVERDVPVAPAMVLKGDPAPVAPPSVPVSRQPTMGLPPKADVIPPAAREPTALVTDRPAKKAKERPMTRPRMSAVQPSAVPIVSTIPHASSRVETRPPEVARPQTMPSMLSAAQAAPPPPSGNRVVYFTVALSLLVVLMAMGIAVKVTTDSASQQIATANERLLHMEQEMTRLRGAADTAAKGESAAMADARAAMAKEEEARKEEGLAQRAAEEAQRKKAEAEAAARRADEEVEEREAEVKRAADDRVRDEAKKKADEARRAAEERRKAADEEARREQTERDRAERERKRAEAQERARIDAEKRAEAKREERRLAEEKAERLKQEREEAAARKDEEKKALAEKKADEKRAAEEKKAAAEEKKAEEEKRKKEEEEQKKREEEEKKLAAVAAPADPQCPKGMVLVKGGAFMIGAPRNDPERNFGDKDYSSIEVKDYCIDFYEYPNGRGRQPTTKVSFKTAEQRCKQRGKRLCSEEEWEKGCKGPSGSRYPYGNQWDPTMCNTEDDEGNDRELSKSGTFRKCRSGYDLFDMSGNVSEWVVSNEGGPKPVVKGGSSDRPGYDGRCAARKKKKGNDAEDFVGFRCCAEPGP
jgi:formylglycine-generating enzyme required for sulfatase activity